MWCSKVFCFAVLLTIARAQDDSILQSAAKFIGSCGDQHIMLCLKERALQAIETAIDGNIEIADGVAIVKDETAVESVTTQEETLPEEGRAREDAVEERIIDRVAKFFTTHKLEFKLPKETSEEVNRSMDEARRRKRKGLRRAQRILLPILALLSLKSWLIFPLLIGGVALIALKAFLVGKVALILALIQVVKKLLHKNKGHESIDVIAHPIHHAPVHDHGWDQGHHHGHDDYHVGGPYRRSMTAQDMAYNAYSTTNNQQ